MSETPVAECPENPSFKFDRSIGGFVFDGEGWLIGEDEPTRAYVAYRKSLGDTPPCIEELLIAKKKLEANGDTLRVDDRVYILNSESEAHKVVKYDEEAFAVGKRQSFDLAIVESVGRDERYALARVSEELYRQLSNSSAALFWDAVQFLIRAMQVYARQHNIPLDSIKVQEATWAGERAVFKFGEAGSAEDVGLYADGKREEPVMRCPDTFCPRPHMWKLHGQGPWLQCYGNRA